MPFLHCHASEGGEVCVHASEGGEVCVMPAKVEKCVSCQRRWRSVCHASEGWHPGIH